MEIIDKKEEIYKIYDIRKSIFFEKFIKKIKEDPTLDINKFENKNFLNVYYIKPQNIFAFFLGNDLQFV